MNLIEDLKEERLARRKAKAVEERQKKLRRKKIKRRGLILTIAGIILGLGVISAVIAYIQFVSTSTFNNQADVEAATDVPTDSPAPAVVIGGGIPESNPPVVSEEQKAPTADSGQYIKTDISGVSFVYPASFVDADGEKVLLYLKDSEGDAVITANKSVTNSDAKTLMKNYADAEGGEVIESVADNSGYEITLIIGNTIKHKKSLVEGSAETYYEITYPADSERADVYEEETEYMDSRF